MARIYISTNDSTVTQRDTAPAQSSKTGRSPLTPRDGSSSNTTDDMSGANSEETLKEKTLEEDLIGIGAQFDTDDQASE